MHSFLQKVKDDGPTNKLKICPLAPSEAKKKSSQQLQDHQIWKLKWGKECVSSNWTKPHHWVLEFKDLSHFRQTLHYQATSMHSYFQCGGFFSQHSIAFIAEKIGAQHSDDWSIWLKTKIGISLSYARRPQKMYYLLYPYTQLFRAISLWNFYIEDRH